MMFHSHCPAVFLFDAFATVVYNINRVPTTILVNKSQYDLVFNFAPSYSHFKPFVYHVYPYVRDYVANKLMPRSQPCIFLGYSSSNRGFWCYNLIFARFFITRHAQFDEHQFPFSSTVTQNDISKLEISSFLEVEPPLLILPQSTSDSPSQPASSPFPCTFCPDTSDKPSSSFVKPPAPPDQQSQPAPPSSSSHPMMTRARAGIFKPCIVLTLPPHLFYQLI